MLYNPIEQWSDSQKVYYLVQLKKLILKIGDRGNRGEAFNKLFSDFNVVTPGMLSVNLHLSNSDEKTRILFNAADIEDRIFILATYLAVLIEEDYFDYSEYNTMISMFDNIYGGPDFNTALCVGLIFEDAPGLENEFHRKKRDRRNKPEQIITRDTIVYLVIMVLAVIGLISIFT